MKYKFVVVRSCGVWVSLFVPLDEFCRVILADISHYFLRIQMDVLIALLLLLMVLFYTLRL